MAGGLAGVPACSGSPSLGPSGGSANSRRVRRLHAAAVGMLRVTAFSQCMRTHQVPGYPDPSNGVPPKERAQRLGVSRSQFQAAQRACQHLLPTTAASRRLSSVALADAVLVQMRAAVARCMRSHGVANWPGPHHRFPGATFTPTCRARRRGWVSTGQTSANARRPGRGHARSWR